jgi:riboflavin synthase
MFTGIVSALGRVAEIPTSGRERLLISHEPGWGRLVVGDSVAVNGCCLTAVFVALTEFAVEVMPETGRRTALSTLAVGDPVNLEAALRLGAAVGGHLVSGHIDAVGRVLTTSVEGNAVRVRLSAPFAVARYCVPQGSISVDGCSLTLVSVEDHDDRSASLEVSLIPHTVQVTVAGRYQPGTAVNLEADMIAKLVERLAAPHRLSRPSSPEPGERGCR